MKEWAITMSSSLSTRSISPLDGENPPSSNLDGPFGKLAIIMVGLPASGKTFTARNISRYMRWLGIRTRLFSVAHVRNKIIGENLTADFFDPCI